MQTIEIDDNIAEILGKENLNPGNILKEYLMMDLLSKREKYDQQVQKMELKYKNSFENTEQEVHSKKNSEDFTIEDDLMEWEFAVESLKKIDAYLQKVK
ncbi:MAG: hypothetical protein GVY19_13990 [Bacteroidetes bacterium]|jgi:hypothetical protein|nr:hypothetical protein [Bacteroidota bacterium]